jgi:limonene-1,2-epoxide hydrolase
MDANDPSPEFVTLAFLRALNRQDVDEMVGLMAPGHRFIDSLGNVIEGDEKLRQAWSGYFRMVPDYMIAVDETYTGVPVVVLLGTAQGTFTRDGKLHTENKWQTPVALRARVENGKLAEWRVYADNEPIRKVMAKSV